MKSTRIVLNSARRTLLGAALGLTISGTLTGVLITTGNKGFSTIGVDWLYA